jgi:3-(3-hydroxy-phenyl)propionate hydroxylase
VHLSPADAQAWQRYGLGQGVDQALVLVRPDGYVMGRWNTLDTGELVTAIATSGAWA